ncbi:hypothetical protein IPL68_02845 [Candidatus Saccharibacteria bacterium]|nr:MAG: hypothetical protein IPL68_02845 [Candidatus Saccharibacteria bacterium]
MKHGIKAFFCALALSMGISGIVVISGSSKMAYALTPNQQAVCEAIDSGADCKDDTPGGGTQIDSVIKTVVRILGVVAGIVAVIMIIVSGIKYISSGGDSSKVASAKSALVYAIVGLFIVALSQVIVRFVLSQSTQATVTCPPGQSRNADGLCVMKVEKL